MSQWTHVCIAIRFDSLLLDPYDEQIVAGKIMNAFSNQLLPEGSEGPVKFSLARTGHAEFPEDSCSSATIDYGLLYIWGDLRDFSDHQLIKAWITKALMQLFSKGVWVRQLAGEIEVEYQGSYVLSTSEEYDHPENFVENFVAYKPEE